MPIDPQRMPLEVELPLAVPYTARDGSHYGFDSYIYNGYVDDMGGEKWVVKRPAIVTYTTYGGGGAATGQGIFQHGDFTFAISDNTLQRINSPTSIGFTNLSNWSAIVAPWQGRVNHNVVSFNGSVYVFGGVGSAIVSPLNLLGDVWSTVDFTSWTQLAAGTPWGNRAWATPSVVVFNNRMVMIGGTVTTDNGATTHTVNDVWASLDGVNWEQLASSGGWPVVGQQNAAVVFRGAIWIFGGALAPGAPAQFLWNSVDGTTWVKINDQLPWAPGKSQYGVLAYKDKLYVIGGNVNGHEVWSTSDGIVWTLITGTAFTPAGLRSFGYCVYNGLMWVIGGLDSLANWNNTVYSSPDGITWTPQGTVGLNLEYGAWAVVHEAAPSVSPYSTTTIWCMGGSLFPGVPFSNNIYRADIGGTLGTSYAIPSSTPYLPMQYAPAGNNRYACIKDTRGMYLWWQNQIQRVTDLNYPNITVPGVVNLDETVYVMTPDALIVGSAINDPTTWPSRNFIGADYLSDGGTAIARYSNYLMALGTSSCQLFYNSGAPGSTLLRPVKNSNSNVGCVHPYSVAQIGGTVMFIGRGEGATHSVFMMDGLVPVPVSDAELDKVLFNASPTNTICFGAILDGHMCYVISGVIVGSLVYDLTKKRWYTWTYAFGDWPANYYATDGFTNYFQNNLLKSIEITTPILFQDRGANAISVSIQTPNMDHGTNVLKTCQRLSIVADQVVGSSIDVQYSDDDHQTYTTARTFSLNAKRVGGTRWGRFRKRSWRFTHSSNTAFRIKAAFLELKLGNN